MLQEQLAKQINDPEREGDFLMSDPTFLLQRQLNDEEELDLDESMDFERMAVEDDFIMQFQNKLAQDNSRASNSKKLKPNLNQEWLDKINKTLGSYREESKISDDVYMNNN